MGDEPAVTVQRLAEPAVREVGQQDDRVADRLRSRSTDSNSAGSCTTGSGDAGRWYGSPRRRAGPSAARAAAPTAGRRAATGRPRPRRPTSRSPASGSPTTPGPRTARGRSCGTAAPAPPPPARPPGTRPARAVRPPRRPPRPSSATVVTCVSFRNSTTTWTQISAYRSLTQYAKTSGSRTAGADAHLTASAAGRQATYSSACTSNPDTASASTSAATIGPSVRTVRQKTVHRAADGNAGPASASIRSSHSAGKACSEDPVERAAMPADGATPCAALEGSAEGRRRRSRTGPPAAQADAAKPSHGPLRTATAPPPAPRAPRCPPRPTASLRPRRRGGRRLARLQYSWPLNRSWTARRRTHLSDRRHRGQPTTGARRPPVGHTGNPMAPEAPDAIKPQPTGRRDGFR